MNEHDDGMRNPFEGNEENPYVSRVENPFRQERQADPQHRVYRQPSEPSSVSLFAWHNYLALVIIGWFALSNLTFVAEESFSSASIFSAIFYFVILGILVLALIRTKDHIGSPHRRRTTVNWATWGYFLLGIGPVIALVRTFRERSKADEEVTTTNWQSPSKWDKDIFGHLE